MFGYTMIYVSVLSSVDRLISYQPKYPDLTYISFTVAGPC